MARSGAVRSPRELVLATRPFAHEQPLRSWWCFGSTLALLLGLLGGTCLDVHWLLRLPFSLGAGVLLVRMFVIYHDYLHGAILRRSWLANAVLTVYGVLMLSPPSIWRRTHDHHHHHNGQYFGDGVGTFQLMTIQEYETASRWRRLAYRVERHPLLILFGYVTIFFASMCVRYVVASPRRHWDAGVAIALHVALVVGLAILAPVSLVFALLLPLSLAAAVGAYLFYAQHNFPAARYDDRADWDYVTAALQSSSYLRAHPVLHWLTGNIGYHHVHHLNARIPFYRLPEAMAGIEELQSPRCTSLHPWEVYRCLRLKFWDPENKRLVGFRERNRSRRSTSGARAPLANSTSAP